MSEFTADHREAAEAWARLQEDGSSGRVSVLGGAYADVYAMADLDFVRMSEKLAPMIFDRLKAMLRGAHAEAHAMAEAAAQVPGLDALSAAALGDWLEERGLGVEAGRVRSLPVQDGDLLVITFPGHLSPEGRGSIATQAKRLEGKLAETGRSVVVVAVPDGIGIKAVRVASRG